MSDDKRKAEEDSPRRTVSMCLEAIRSTSSLVETLRYTLVLQLHQVVPKRGTKLLPLISRQALKRTEVVFRLSLVFMSAGALIILVGGGLALARRQSELELPAGIDKSVPRPQPPRAGVHARAKLSVSPFARAHPCETYSTGQWTCGDVPGRR